MLRIEMVQSYVRDLMEGITGSRPEPDESGEMRLDADSSPVSVAVVRPQDPMVRIVGVAAIDVAESNALYRELNEMNEQMRFARACLRDRIVVVETEIWGVDVTAENFGYACHIVGSLTETAASVVVKEFGGSPFLAETESSAGDNKGGPDENGEDRPPVSDESEGIGIGDPTPSEFKGGASKPGDDLPGMYL